MYFPRAAPVGRRLHQPSEADSWGSAVAAFALWGWTAVQFAALGVATVMTAGLGIVVLPTVALPATLAVLTSRRNHAAWWGVLLLPACAAPAIAFLAAVAASNQECSVQGSSTPGGPSVSTTVCPHARGLPGGAPAYVAAGATLAMLALVLFACTERRGHR